MPTFDFTTSTSVTGTGSSFTINFTDTSSGSPVNFTLSTSGNSGVLNAQFSVVNQISITDTVAGGAFVLALNPTQSLNNIGPTGAGSVTLNLGTYVSGTWNITLVHETNTALNLITTVSAGAAGAAISVPTTETTAKFALPQLVLAPTLLQSTALQPRSHATSKARVLRHRQVVLRSRRCSPVMKS